MKKASYLFVATLFLFGSDSFCQIVKPGKVLPVDTTADKQKPGITAQWYNELIDELNSHYELVENAPDTNRLKQVILTGSEKIDLFRREFNTMPDGLAIRYLYDLKMEIANVQTRLQNSKKIITAHFKDIARRRITYNNGKKIIYDFLKDTDSSIAKLYNQESTFLLNQIDEGLEFANSRLQIYARFKDDLLVVSNQASQLHSEVSRELSSREARLFRRELPPIWKSSPSDYHDGFIHTMVKTAQRSYETFKSYVASSIVTVILFRLFLYLLFLLPVYYYFKNPIYSPLKNKIKGPELDRPESLYFDNNPFVVSFIMGLALSPIIFVNAPHSFLELVFLTLVFAVCIYTFKNYPKVDWQLILWIFVPYLVLYLLNFFITPTFLSRIIWSFCILILIPLSVFLKRARQFNLAYEGFVRSLVIFLMFHIAIGWIWIMTGRYAMGKSVVLAAYNLLILAIIFRIAIFSFLDYLAIVATMINHKFDSIHINYRQLVRIILPFLYLVNFLILAWSYLANLNMFEFTSAAIQRFLEEPRTINNIEFDYKSILLFVASVYLAFLVSNLLRATFEQTPDLGSVGKKSRFGSYVILFRLLIISIGFVIAIIISGIPVSTFTVIFGALSLGIGFGLQSMVANIFSGLFIAFERPFVVGDFVEYGLESGRVKEIGLRATRILTVDGADVLIPNGALLSNNIKNWTYSDNHKAVSIDIPVDHGEDHMKIQSLISEAVRGQAGIINRNDTPILLSEIKENSTIYKITLTVDNLGNAPKIKGEFMNRLYSLFKDNDVKLPEISLKDLQVKEIHPAS